MKNRKYFFLLIVPVIFGVLSAVVMWLWNAILPQLFEINTISYWQALGLLLLSRILLGNFGFGGRRPPFGGPPPHFRKRWMKMSEEEKQKLKEEWRKRCGRPDF